MPLYTVVMYNIPKVSEDGAQALPIPAGKTSEFSELTSAQGCAAEHKDQFDRVLLMNQTDEGQKLVERYVEGKHELAESIVRR